jgi:hypothetical protein
LPEFVGEMGDDRLQGGAALGQADRDRSSRAYGRARKRRAGGAARERPRRA